MLRGRIRAGLLAFGTVVVAGALVAGGMAAPALAARVVDTATAVARILADTNAFRVQNGLPPLVENAGIDAVSGAWAARMAVPTSQGGPGFVHNPGFFSQMPAGATSGGENIAAGFTYDTVVTDGWAKSPAHRENMLGTWTDIGIGYWQSADGSTTYLVQNFGYYPAHVGTSTPPPTSTPTPTPTPSATPTPTPTPSSTPSSPPSGGTGALPPLSSLPTPVVSTATAPVPKVVGNGLVDSRTGQPWTAHAVNWPSFEYACQQGWGYASDGRTTAAAQAMASWGITAVRLPLNEDCWLGTDGSPRYGTAGGYQAAIRQWVDILNAAGLVVILDLHWSAPTGTDSDGQRPMTDPQSLPFWQQVAYAYSKAPSVMFDAFNEPYSRGSATLDWSCWANGGCTMPASADTQAVGTKTFTVVGMKDVVATIRAAKGTQPILLGGLDYANDLRGWLAATRPFGDAQLVASWHNYPGQRCQTATCWNSEIAPVAAQVPVIATEFGETDGGSTFLTTFMDWADAHGVGYAPWAWWWTDASDGAAANAYALVQNGTFTPKAPAGTAYATHLASLAGTSPDRPVGIDRDFSGSPAPDLLASAPDGQLRSYQGNGTGGWEGMAVVGSGWTSMTAVVDVGDFDGDGKPDVLARDTGGLLWLYPGKGNGSWGARKLVGSGWNGLTFLGSGDFDGDGHPDVIARMPSGELRLYPGNGTGGWLATRTIGSGWQAFRIILAPGDFDGDGHPDVLAIQSSGALVLYRGNGTGSWLPGSRVVGSGWTFPAVCSAGDFTGDGAPDLFARNASGALLLYRSTGTGSWLSGAPVIGSGWNTMRMIC